MDQSTAQSPEDLLKRIVQSKSVDEVVQTAKTQRLIEGKKLASSYIKKIVKKMRDSKVEDKYILDALMKYDEWAEQGKLTEEILNNLAKA